MNKVVIAIDFDGTICEVSYPDVGLERKGAKEFINKLHDEGYLIIINTCRTDGNGEYAARKAKDYLIARGIKFDHFNENAPHLIEQYGMDCRKISADVYIDDKCLYTLPTWEEKYQIIKTKFPEPLYITPSPIITKDHYDVLSTPVQDYEENPEVFRFGG